MAQLHSGVRMLSRRREPSPPVAAASHAASPARQWPKGCSGSKNLYVMLFSSGVSRGITWRCFSDCFPLSFPSDGDVLVLESVPSSDRLSIIPII